LGCVRDLILLNRVSLQVNRTFQELGVIRDLGGMWEEMSPKVWDFLEDSKEMNFLRVRRLLLQQHDWSKQICSERKCPIQTDLS